MPDQNSTKETNSNLWEVRPLDFLTWLLVVFGWLAVHNLAKRRDQINRLSSSIETALGRIEEIEELAIPFWQSPGITTNKQMVERQRMIMKIGHLERLISDIGNKKRFRNIDEKLNEFSKSVLDGDGESSARPALKPEDQRFSRIANTATALSSELRKAL